MDWIHQRKRNYSSRTQPHHRRSQAYHSLSSVPPSEMSIHTRQTTALQKEILELKDKIMKIEYHNQQLLKKVKEQRKELDILESDEVVMNQSGMLLYEGVREKVEKLEKENEKLKKENEKLKKQNATWLEYKNVAEQDIDNMRNIFGKDLAWNECLKEAKEMKEELKELKQLKEDFSMSYKYIADVLGYEQEYNDYTSQHFNKQPIQDSFTDWGGTLKDECNSLKLEIETLERENRITFGAWQYEVGTLKKLEAWKYEVIQTAKVMDWDLPEEDEDA